MVSRVHIIVEDSSNRSKIVPMFHEWSKCAIQIHNLGHQTVSVLTLWPTPIVALCSGPCLHASPPSPHMTRTRRTLVALGVSTSIRLQQRQVSASLITHVSALIHTMVQLQDTSAVAAQATSGRM